MTEADAVITDFAERFPDAFARTLRQGSDEEISAIVGSLPPQSVAAVVARLPSARLLALLESGEHSPRDWLEAAPFDLRRVECCQGFEGILIAPGADGLGCLQVDESLQDQGHRVPQDVHAHGVESAHGLVHDQDLRLVQDGGDELGLLLHAFRQLVGLALPPVLEAEPLERLLERSPHRVVAAAGTPDMREFFMMPQILVAQIGHSCSHVFISNY